MSSHPNLKAGLVLFENDFQLEKSYLDLEGREEVQFEEAFLLIMRVVEELLSKDFSRLVNCLYRLDVSEEKLKEALAASNDNPASVITQMIIEREMQKVETREKYRS